MYTSNLYEWTKVDEARWISTYDEYRHADPDERELMNLVEFKKRLKKRIRRERE